MGVFFVFCVLIILFLKLWIVCNGKQLFSNYCTDSAPFLLFCMFCDGVDSILFMYKLYVASLCLSTFAIVRLFGSSRDFICFILYWCLLCSVNIFVSAVSSIFLLLLGT